MEKRTKERDPQPAEFDIQAAADKALDLLDRGDIKGAIKSMAADAVKLTEVMDQRLFIMVGSRELLDDPKLTEEKARDFIEGFAGVEKRPRFPKKEVPKPTEFKFSKENIENTEDFIDRFILNNKDLTPEAKEAAVNESRTRPGPWIHKNEVIKVSQKGKQILVHHKSGTAFLYIR